MPICAYYAKAVLMGSSHAPRPSHAGSAHAGRELATRRAAWLGSLHHVDKRSPIEPSDEVSIHPQNLQTAERVYPRSRKGCAITSKRDSHLTFCIIALLAAELTGGVLEATQIRAGPPADPPSRSFFTPLNTP